MIISYIIVSYYIQYLISSYLISYHISDLILTQLRQMWCKGLIPRGPANPEETWSDESFTAELSQLKQTTCSNSQPPPPAPSPPCSDAATQLHPPRLHGDSHHMWRRLPEVKPELPSHSHISIFWVLKRLLGNWWKTGCTASGAADHMWVFDNQRTLIMHVCRVVSRGFKQPACVRPPELVTTTNVADFGVP